MLFHQMSFTTSAIYLKSLAKTIHFPTEVAANKCLTMKENKHVQTHY